MRLKFASSVTVLGSRWQTQSAQLFVLQMFAEIYLEWTPGRYSRYVVHSTPSPCFTPKLRF